jgi:hypothetical protein
MFEAATYFTIGNGERARFWTDRWLDGSGIMNLAPNLVAKVPARRANSRSVKDGLAGAWLQDCGPDVGAEALAKFFLL